MSLYGPSILFVEAVGKTNLASIPHSRRDGEEPLYTPLDHLQVSVNFLVLRQMDLFSMLLALDSW